MIRSDFDSWRKELIVSGAIIQDDDNSVSPERAEYRFNRYIELLEMVRGDEPEMVFHAIVDSIQVEEDYGAYEAVYNALWRFPPDKFSQYFISALPGFIQRFGEDVGRFLVGLTGSVNAEYLSCFNRVLDLASKEDLSIIVSFIEGQEINGWFEDAPGVIRPNVGA